MKIKDLKVGDYLIYTSDDTLGGEYKDLNVVRSIGDNFVQIEAIQVIKGGEGLIGITLAFLEDELYMFSIPTEEELIYLL